MNLKTKLSYIVFILFLYLGSLFCSDLNSIITTQSNDIEENIVESWGRQKDFFIRNNFNIINWKQAETILLNEEIQGGKQYHTGWLTIFLVDGSKYIVKQPSMDSLWKFMEEKNIKLKGFGTE